MIANRVLLLRHLRDRFLIDWHGQGVPMDDVRAHMWFNLAAVRGVVGAVKNRDIIAKLMTPQQMAEAQKLARECQARNFKGC